MASARAVAAWALAAAGAALLAYAAVWRGRLTPASGLEVVLVLAVGAAGAALLLLAGVLFAWPRLGAGARPFLRCVGAGYLAAAAVAFVRFAARGGLAWPDLSGAVATLAVVLLGPLARPDAAVALAFAVGAGAMAFMESRRGRAGRPT